MCATGHCIVFVLYQTQHTLALKWGLCFFLLCFPLWAGFVSIGQSVSILGEAFEEKKVPGDDDDDDESALQYEF